MIKKIYPFGYPDLLEFDAIVIRSYKAGKLSKTKYSYVFFTGYMTEEGLNLANRTANEIINGLMEQQK
jgi:hypothetical protein